MSVTDNGPHPNAFDIESATLANEDYRTVAWSGKYLQVTLMSIPAGESIGLEAHPETDQFLRLEAGQGRCVMGPSADQLDFEQEVSDDWSIQVPAGVWHDVINTPPASSRPRATRPSRTRTPGATSHRPGRCSPGAARPTSTRSACSSRSTFQAYDPLPATGPHAPESEERS